jgi:hypothetical protein
VSAEARRTEVAGLRLADPPELWTELGFAVDDGGFELGGVWVELGAAGLGIVGWQLRGMKATDSLDGLPTEVIEQAAPRPGARHPNGAVGIDHVVVLTPRFARTAAALADAGLDLRRIRHTPGGFRQGFRRLGPVILELVETLEETDGPARFWGLVVNVAHLDALAERLGGKLGEIKSAVQPGRRIATLRHSAGLGEAVAFMSVEGH